MIFLILVYHQIIQNAVKRLAFCVIFGDYRGFKDLAKRIASDKVLGDKAFNIAKNSKYDGYQRGIASMAYKFFDKKSTFLSDKSVPGNGVNTQASNEKLAEELHKPIIRKF